jgi:hypothetical protein
MPVTTIHAYLVHPGRNVDQLQPVGGSLVPHEGDLFRMLSDIFHATDDQRDVDIVFSPQDNGNQFNTCRSLIVQHTANPTIQSGAALAERLRASSDNRSGMGLLFLMTGNNGLDSQFVMSRFPAESAILAELREDGLTVEFLERVFVKRATAYKSIRLRDQNPRDNFWSGKVTDRQLGGQIGHISNYWMSDFLNAEILTTPAAGTRRLVMALHSVVMKHPNIDVQAEIAAAVGLAGGALQGRVTSIDGFCDHFGFGVPVRQAIESQVPSAELRQQQFQFDAGEFSNRLPYRSLTLDNGAILTALAREFNDVFEITEREDGRKEYTTIGRRRNERLLVKA